MKMTRRREWFQLAAFVGTGLVAFGVFYLLAFKFISPAQDVHDYYAGVIGFEDTAGPLETMLKAAPAGAIGTRLVLARDTEVLVGETVLIYRGLAAGRSFDIDVIIPAYDPQSPFRHRFSLAEARKRFVLGPHTYRLLSATRSVLHLEPTGG
ncbi:MAG: hypothetical protein WAK95_04105 [Desulfobacterales bacterium]